MKLFLFIITIVLFIFWFLNQNSKVISTDDAPSAIGPYSQAILVDNTLYLSGQIAINPETNELVNDSFENEVRQIMKNHKAILTKSKMDFSNVVKATVYMTDLNNFSKFNDIYKEYFPKNPPARETIEVSRLPKDANIEISFIAVKSY